jgi:flagellar basal body-associated protein FliL
MKAFIIATLIVGMIAAGGCIQTPATVAKETPGVLKNISEKISTMETPNVTAAEERLQPVKASVEYQIRNLTTDILSGNKSFVKVG